MGREFMARGKQILPKILQKRWITVLTSVMMIFITIGVLGFLVYRNKEILLTFQWKLNILPLAAALGVHGFAMLLGTFVWAGIINVLGSKLRFRQHFRYFCLNMIARRLPGTLWYVAYRAQTYNRHGITVKLTSLASGIELAVAIISGVITAFFFAIPILARNNFSPWLFVIFFLVGLAFLYPPFLRWLVKKISAQSAEIRIDKILLWVGAYIALWVCGGYILFLLINTIYPLAYDQLGFVIGCWVIAGTVSFALVFLPSNFGFTEVSLSLLLSQLLPSSLAVIIAILSRIIFTLFELFWSFLSLLLIKD